MECERDVADTLFKWNRCRALGLFDSTACSLEPFHQHDFGRFHVEPAARFRTLTESRQSLCIRIQLDSRFRPVEFGEGDVSVRIVWCVSKFRRGDGKLFDGARVNAQCKCGVGKRSRNAVSVCAPYERQFSTV